MSTVLKKSEAYALIDSLPENATWDDLMRQIYVRKTIERGLSDSQSGRTLEVQEVRSKYGLPE
jgi:predicted transcriptional regulator